MLLFWEKVGKNFWVGEVGRDWRVVGWRMAKRLSCWAWFSVRKVEFVFGGCDLGDGAGVGGKGRLAIGGGCGRRPRMGTLGLSARVVVKSWAGLLLFPRGRFVEWVAVLFGALFALVPLLSPSSLCFHPNVHPLALAACRFSSYLSLRTGSTISILMKADLVGRSVAISVVGSVSAGRSAGGKPVHCDGEQRLIRSDQFSFARVCGAFVASRGAGMAARLAAASWALFVPRGRFVEGLAVLFGALFALVPLPSPIRPSRLAPSLAYLNAYLPAARLSPSLASCLAPGLASCLAPCLSRLQVFLVLVS